MNGVLAGDRLFVRHRASDHDALRDLRLQVARGEILALVGPNGAGKSTALAALARAIEPRFGVVRLDGADVRDLRRRELARRLARLPQSPACAEGLTVEDLVTTGRHPHRPILGGLARADRAAVRAALAAVDMIELARRKVETLSGGERRRAWLGMVLCQSAPVLLLDEPTAGLDLRHQHELLALLARLNRDQALTIVVTLHDVEQACWLAHRIAVLHQGRLYDVGPPAACISEQMLREVFGVCARVRVQDGRIRVHVLGSNGAATGKAAPC